MSQRVEEARAQVRNMTMEVYAHLLDGAGKQMATTMGAILHG